jgi:hypothetical protein
MMPKVPSSRETKQVQPTGRECDRWFASIKLCPLRLRGFRRRVFRSAQTDRQEEIRFSPAGKIGGDGAASNLSE